MCKAKGEDIPELTERSVCRVKASSGAHYAFNRGGTVEFMLHPQCSSIEDGAFYFSAERRAQSAERGVHPWWRKNFSRQIRKILLITFLIRKVMPARRGQEKSDVNIARRGALLFLAWKSNTKHADYSIYILLLMEDIQWL